LLWYWNRQAKNHPATRNDEAHKTPQHNCAFHAATSREFICYLGSLAAELHRGTSHTKVAAIMKWKTKLRWWPEVLLGISLLWLAYTVWQKWH